MIEHTNSRAWSVARVQGVEVFRAPDGAEFRRASEESATDVIVSERMGLKTFLRPASSEKLERAAARAERTLEKREGARRRRASTSQSEESEQ